MSSTESESTGRPAGGSSRHDRLDTLTNIAIILSCLIVAGAAVAIVALRWREPPVVEPTPTTVRGTPPPPVPLPDLPIRVNDAAALGDIGARVLLVMFSDFQCPFCRAFTLNTLAALNREYFQTGRVRLIFRHLPLESIHPQALAAGVGAECARRQGHFWEMHDALFATGGKGLDGAAIDARAQAIGLDMAAFASCAAGDGRDAVRRDLTEAGRLGVTGTPGFIIATMADDGTVRPRRRLSGARPIDEFRAALDEVLEETGATTAR